MSQRNHRTATILALAPSGNRQSRPDGEGPADDPSELKRKIFLRLIAEHGGSCFALAGLDTTAEFSNAVEAIRCAVEIQQAMLVENKRLPLEERLLLRIGLHIGDVREEESRYRGEGVDTAVGLEELALPGGICLSGAVYEQVKHRARVAIEFAGEKQVSYQDNC